MAARLPLIGLTSYLEAARWGDSVREAALLPVRYVRAVERAGGMPVLLPPAESAGLASLLNGLDGVVLTGGGDVDPSLYGAEPHEATHGIRPERDRFELALARAVIDARKPFLAICRGMQVLNVARGGNLIQHLPDAVHNDSHGPELGKMGSHRVRISGTSMIGRIIGAEADVPTAHHQAVKRLGKGLVATAWTDDQVVEAVELQGHPFGIGVQWHPEEGDDSRLLEALGEAALAG